MLVKVCTSCAACWALRGWTVRHCAQMQGSLHTLPAGTMATMSSVSAVVWEWRHHLQLRCASALAADNRLEAPPLSTDNRSSNVRIHGHLH